MKSPSCENIKGNDKLDPLFFNDISEHSKSSSCTCHCFHFLLAISKNTNNNGLGVGKDKKAVVRCV